jgi:hypothetical protein
MRCKAAPGPRCFNSRAKELQLTRMEYNHTDRRYYSVDGYPLRDGLRAASGAEG